MSKITVALIGGDGSGKSTIAKKLLNEFSPPMKYIYMGANIESSNYVLPWSKLALKLKLLRLKKKARERGIDDPVYLTTHHMEHRQHKSGFLRTFLRLSNRLLEVFYRHIISWIFQLRGYHVIYDRYFLFDAAQPTGKIPWRQPGKIVNRVYYWILLHLFPIPDLILFLNATPEIMVARKKEATVEYLRAHNEAWLRQGASFENFITIDADQSIEKVYADITEMIQIYSGEIKTTAAAKAT